MNDFQIRKAIKEQELINHLGDPDTKIIDEMGLNLGSSIIDIAVVNGNMLGYEIKSDRDTLNRLNSQIEQYNKVFDYLNIVTGNPTSSMKNSRRPDTFCQNCVIWPRLLVWRVGDMGVPWLARRLLIAISSVAVQISMHDFFKGPLHLFFKRRADLF